MLEHYRRLPCRGAISPGRGTTGNSCSCSFASVAPADPDRVLVAGPRASGRTSRRGPRRRSPPRQAARATRVTETQARLSDVSAPRPRTLSARRRCVLVPVGALEDPGLALEPAAVRLGDVVRRRREDVEDEAAARLEQPVHGAERRAAVGVRLHVQQRAERDDDERVRRPRPAGRAGRRGAGRARRPRPPRARARPRASPRDESTPITAIPLARDRHRDPSGADRRARRPARPSAAPPRRRTRCPRPRSPTRGRRDGRSVVERTRRYAARPDDARAIEPVYAAPARAGDAGARRLVLRSHEPGLAIIGPRRRRND